MNYDQHVYELTTFRVQQRVLKPDQFLDDVVDPGVNFDKCCKQIQQQVAAELSKPENQTATGQNEYFHAQARDALRWCFDNRAPHLLTQKVQSWLLAT